MGLKAKKGKAKRYVLVEKVAYLFTNKADPSLVTLIKTFKTTCVDKTRVSAKISAALIGSA